MIQLNKMLIETNKFPDGTPLIKLEIPPIAFEKGAVIDWYYENNEEFITLIFLTKHLREHGIFDVFLNMPYVPNARQDRTKAKDVFTLKYFADIINYLDFNSVQVLDVHSYVSEALINRVVSCSPANFIALAAEKIIKENNLEKDKLHVFYPDEGAMKRYSGELKYKKFSFGIKQREWETGKIIGLKVDGAVENIKDSTILIVDDICSKGGTFYHSAKKLKELGAKNIYLWVTHCENTILEGELLTSGLIEKVYTTNSIYTKNNDKIEVFSL